MIETQQTFLGKTQAFFISEVQSEKLISWARLSLAFGFVVLSLVGRLLGQVSENAFLMSLGAILFLCICSGYYLFRSSRRPMGAYAVYVLTFVDVTVITIVIAAHSIFPVLPSTNSIHIALFCAYFLVATFTALHFRTSLVLFGSILSVVEYSIFYFWLVAKGDFGFSVLTISFWIQVIILISVAVLSSVISRNNFQTFQKVVSSEIKYQNLVHRLPEMLFTLDAKLNFAWANNASYAILGIPAKALRHRNIRDVLTNPSSFKLGSHGIRGTFEIKDFEENRKFVDCSLIPSEDKDNTAVWEGIMTDVTDRELAITQREEMVHRLFHYQKMESLGTLASGMAHDFNNILQTITDVTGQVSGQTNEPETQKRMALISETMVDARFLISELLALGQKTPLTYKSIELRQFFDKIIPQFNAQLEPSCQTTFVMKDETLTINGDADYLKRVFKNLYGNARDAMPNGGTITIECFADRKEGGAGNIIIRFSDTGTGIPQEIIGKIFDPFFTTKKPGKGTGLGLALVQRIVSLHNGRISVEKTDSRGTTFRIELPEIEKYEPGEDTRWILSNRITARLLLLDDDKKIRDVLKFFLKEFGYKICEATDLDTATSELKKNPDTSVVIMDWKLGSEDPHAAIRMLRSVKKDIMVLVVSGYPPNVKSIEEMKIFRWFTKPYDKNQLDLEIQRALHLLSRQ